MIIMIEWMNLKCDYVNGTYLRLPSSRKFDQILLRLVNNKLANSIHSVRIHASFIFLDTNGHGIWIWNRCWPYFDSECWTTHLPLSSRFLVAKIWNFSLRFMSSIRPPVASDATPNTFISISNFCALAKWIQSIQEFKEFEPTYFFKNLS